MDPEEERVAAVKAKVVEFYTKFCCLCIELKSWWSIQSSLDKGSIFSRSCTSTYSQAVKLAGGIKISTILKSNCKYFEEKYFRFDDKILIEFQLNNMSVVLDDEFDFWANRKNRKAFDFSTIRPTVASSTTTSSFP